MTVEEAHLHVKAIKFFISQIWISNEPLLRATYTDLDKAEQEYQEIAFGGVTNVTRASD